MNKSIIALALVGATFAAPSLKNRLGEVNAKNLAQATFGGEYPSTPVESAPACGDFNLPTLPFTECPCVFNDLPGVGAGENSGL